MFCPTCGNQIPDGTKFCPSCGTSLAQPPTTENATPAAADSAPAPSAKKQKKEPGKVRKLLFGSLSVGAIIAIILVTQVAKYLVKQGFKNTTNPEPTATQQPANPETDTIPDQISDRELEDAMVRISGMSLKEQAESTLEAYSDFYALTNCTLSVDNGRMQTSLFSSVTSDGPDAAELSARFQQQELSEEEAQLEAVVIAALEQELGVTGITDHFILYYADGTVCGEALWDSTGLIEHYSA